MCEKVTSAFCDARASAMRAAVRRGIVAALASGLAWVVVSGCRGAGNPRGVCDPLPAPGQVGSVCGFRNPEDVELVAPAGVLFVSQMAPFFGGGGGSLAAVTLDSLEAGTPLVRTLWPVAGEQPQPAAAPAGDLGCTTPPAADSFAPHGLASAVSADGTIRLAVVTHAPREAVELFDVEGSGEATRLAWRGCVPLPPRTSGNDLVLRPDGSLAVANYLPSFGGVSGALWMLVSSLGVRSGDVITWSPKRGWIHLPGSAARGANGVALDEETSVLWFTETGASRVARVDPRGADSVRGPIEGAPDNLSWTSRRTLVTATHLSASAFLACAAGRLPCRAPWALVEIDPETLATTVLVRHDGAVVGAATGAVEWRGRFYLGAVFDDRLGVWTPPPG